MRIEPHHIVFMLFSFYSQDFRLSILLYYLNYYHMISIHVGESTTPSFEGSACLNLCAAMESEDSRALGVGPYGFSYYCVDLGRRMSYCAGGTSLRKRIRTCIPDPRRRMVPSRGL
jgi:hypothetical protein